MESDNNSETKPPVSAYDKTLGMMYFARMLDKIRRHDRGELHTDYHAFVGKGMDGKCVGFLRVDHDALRRRTLDGGSNEEILKWCFSNGRELDDGDIFIWNEFARKVGWNDFASESLARRKLEAGLEGRDEIMTMPEYFEYDEGRKAG